MRAPRIDPPPHPHSVERGAGRSSPGSRVPPVRGRQTGQLGWPARIVAVGIWPFACWASGTEGPGLVLLVILSTFAVSAIATSRRYLGWDRQTRRQLLRPEIFFQVFFLGYYLLGGACFAMDLYGYRFLSQVRSSSPQRLELAAEAQLLMLWAQAAVSFGMTIRPFGSGEPRYRLRRLSAETLLGGALVLFAVAWGLQLVGSLWAIGTTVERLGRAAIAVQVGQAIRERRLLAFLAGAALLLQLMVRDATSGWKGPILYTVLTLCALAYPRVRALSVAIGTLMIGFWLFVIHPFGGALRPLLWYQELPKEVALSIALERAMTMDLEERVDNAWEALSGRAGETSQFCQYIVWVRSQDRFLGLDIARQALWGLVPRLAWRAKPDMEKLSMERVYLAGVVSRTSKVSAKSTFFQDAWMSGGVPALLVLSTLIGMAASSAARLCESYFGGYAMGVCIVHMGLFGFTLCQPQNLEFLVGSVATAAAIAAGTFGALRVSRLLVPVRRLPSAAKPRRDPRLGARATAPSGA